MNENDLGLNLLYHDFFLSFKSSRPWFTGREGETTFAVYHSIFFINEQQLPHTLHGLG